MPNETVTINGLSAISSLNSSVVLPIYDTTENENEPTKKVTLNQLGGFIRNDESYTSSGNDFNWFVFKPGTEKPEFSIGQNLQVNTTRPGLVPKLPSEQGIQFLSTDGWTNFGYSDASENNDGLMTKESYHIVYSNPSTASRGTVQVPSSTQSFNRVYTLPSSGSSPIWQGVSSIETFIPPDTSAIFEKNSNFPSNVNLEYQGKIRKSGNCVFLSLNHLKFTSASGTVSSIPNNILLNFYQGFRPVTVVYLNIYQSSQTLPRIGRGRILTNGEFWLYDGDSGNSCSSILDCLNGSYGLGFTIVYTTS